MNMKDWMIKYIPIFLLGVMATVLTMRECSRPPSVQAPIVKSRDTTINNYFYRKDSTTVVKPGILKEVPFDYNDLPSQYRPETKYQLLLEQYQTLLVQLMNKRIYSDSFKIDTIGTAYIQDTVERNLLISRSFRYKLNYFKTDTNFTVTQVILPPKPKNQWFIGSGLAGNKRDFINELNANLLLITKKGKGYTIGTGINKDGLVEYRVGLYWKL